MVEGVGVLTFNGLLALTAVVPSKMEGLTPGDSEPEPGLDPKNEGDPRIVLVVPHCLTEVTKTPHSRYCLRWLR